MIFFQVSLGVLLFFWVPFTVNAYIYAYRKQDPREQDVVALLMSVQNQDKYLQARKSVAEAIGAGDYQRVAALKDRLIEVVRHEGKGKVA